MEEKYNARQQQIIDSAIELIGTYGIQGLTIKNLSKEVGVAESALYRHFESKTEIMSSVLLFLRSNIVKKYTEVLNKNTGTIEKLKKLIEQHLKIFNERPSLTIVLFSDGMYKMEPELTQKILSIMQFVKSSFIMILDEGQKNKSIRQDISSEQLAFMIMGSIRLTLNQWSIQNYKYKLSPKGKELWDTISKIVSES